ncbi:unnamed protein product [Phaedon cochleariae]|uniref:Ig-like domain-containing protein n=1 Tax=Phaedon cochleariae TaxID=80249 RepID=A0A9N9SBB5_PHACE|nr:unnamed protein product [Phaedon cochleariae]
MEVKRIAFVVCLFVAFGNCLPRENAKSKPDEFEDTYGGTNDEDVQNDNYDEYGATDVEAPPDDANDVLKPEVEAYILTKPQVVVAKFGDTVRLPCEVSNSEVVTVWQKDGTLIYQGHIPIGKLPNTLEYANGSLEVNVTAERDFGSYACVLMVANEEKKRPQVVHRIVPVTPANIESLVAKNNKTVYKVGESLTLTCTASGYPKPEISWHRGSKRLAIHGNTLMIPELKVEEGGVYRCLADNKVSKPSHHHITISVEHAPIIEIEKYIVNADQESEAELTCTVDAYPEAHVVWKKDNTNIVSKGNVTVTVKRHQNTLENVLVINGLREEDFGAYVCLAKNGLGKVEKKVSLVKTPAVREFVKPDKANRDVVLAWKVESRSPISMHEIQYRKKGEEQWQTAKPEVDNGVHNMYTVKYTLKDLDAGSYETRVRSRNNHGWSEFSDIIPFEGVLAKHGSAHKNHNKKHHKDKKEKHITSTPGFITVQQREIIQNEASVGETHIASTPGSLPAQHQEINQKEASVGASQSSGHRSSISSTAVLSIVLILIWINRQ